MGEARNHALAGFGDEPLDWLVVVDVDIYVRPTHVWQLIEVLQRSCRVSMAQPVRYKIFLIFLVVVLGAITTPMPYWIIIITSGLLVRLFL